VQNRCRNSQTSFSLLILRCCLGCCFRVFRLMRSTGSMAGDAWCGAFAFHTTATKTAFL
jgi:hypothetical protein